MLAIMRMVVVLPEPLGPMKPYTEPSGTVNDRLSTAVTSANVFVTFEIWTASIDPKRNRFSCGPPVCGTFWHSGGQALAGAGLKPRLQRRAPTNPLTDRL